MADDGDAARAARMNKWWADWWAADYSWDGLAKKPWQGWVRPDDGGACVEKTAGVAGRKATLQDYFIDRLGPEVTLIASPDGLLDKPVRFTRLHLPLTWPGGTSTGKADWPEDALDEDLRTLLAQAGPPLEGDPRFGGPDRRAQCDGVVFLDFALGRILADPARGDDDWIPLALSCENAAFSGDARFNNAAFSGDASFDNAAFSGLASFDKAAFSGNTWFGNAAFSGGADFDNAAFSGEAHFENAVFSGDAHFNKAAFSGDARFENAAFSGGADFDNAAFSGEAHFENAVFSGDAHFNKAAFSGDARFENAAFSGSAIFSHVALSGDARFDNAAFSGIHNFFVSAAFFGEARFDNSAFFGHARFESAAFHGYASFRRAIFYGEARFQDTAFSGHARFDSAAFSREARFYSATFSRGASFDDTTFFDDVRFNDAAFSGDASFCKAAFSRRARFTNAAFCKSLILRGCHFEDNVSFTGRAQTVARPSETHHFEWAPLHGEGSGRQAKGRIVLPTQILPSAYRSVDRVSAEGAVFVGDVDFGNRDILSDSSFAGATFLGLAKFHGASLHQWVDLPRDVFVVLEYVLVEPGLSRVGTWRRGARMGGANTRLSDVASAWSAPGATSRWWAEWLWPLFKRRWPTVSLKLMPARLRKDGKPLEVLDDADWTTAVEAWTVEVQAMREQRASAATDARYIEIEACFRTLKQTMEDSRSRLAESDFFKLELKARRRRKDRDWWEKAFSDTYGAMSDYGASAFRPMIWLAASLVGFALIYYGAANGFTPAPPSAFDGQPWQVDTDFQNALRYSGSRMMPFGALGEETWEWREALLAPTWQGGLMRVLATVQSLLAAILSFQIALAVRRRFQMT